MQLFIGYLFRTLFGAKPFVDDLNAGAKDEDQEEHGDIARR